MSEKNKKNRSILKCLVCRKLYDDRDIFVVEQTDSRTLFHLTCAKCRSKSLNILSAGQSGVVGIGMLTDLARDEMEPVGKMSGISADEVIDCHEMTKTGRE